MLKKLSLWKKILVLSGLLVLLGGISVGAYAYHIYSQVEQTAQNIYKPISNKEGGGKPKKALEEQETPKPISILLMGVDKRPGDFGRSDVMIVLTLNPKTNTMQMVSIPRDTRITLEGYGYEKINHAYAFGGSSLAVKTVEDFININIDYYIRLNMKGLADLVNAVGGITVYNDDSWHDPGYYKKGYFYHEGKLHLNGAQAIGFVRMRYIPGGDFARNEHQREVIKAIIDKAASFSSFTRYQNVLEAIEDHVKTNLTFDDMKYIAMNYRDCRKNLEMYEVKGNGETINGIWYLLVNKQERQKVHNMIKEQLVVASASDQQNNQKEKSREDTNT